MVNEQVLKRTQSRFPKRSAIQGNHTPKSAHCAISDVQGLRKWKFRSLQGTRFVCSRVEKLRILFIAGKSLVLQNLSDVQGYINWQFCSLQGTNVRRRYFWTLLLLTASSPYFQWQVRPNPALNQLVKCKSLVLLLTIFTMTSKIMNIWSCVFQDFNQSWWISS